MAHDTKRRVPRGRAALAVPAGIYRDAESGCPRGPQAPPGRATAEIRLRPPRLVALSPDQAATARALLGELIAARASVPMSDRLTFSAGNGLIRPGASPEPTGTA
jgi:hypothetical protein